MEVTIQKRTLEFWIIIAKFCLKLKDKRYYEVASQLFKSWTSIWANVCEAQGWQSKKDFISKLSIALKESYETLYWLEILYQGFNEDTSEIKQECEQITKILTAIIKKSKQTE